MVWGNEHHKRLFFFHQIYEVGGLAIIHPPEDDDFAKFGYIPESKVDNFFCEPHYIFWRLPRSYGLNLANSGFFFPTKYGDEPPGLENTVCVFLLVSVVMKSTYVYIRALPTEAGLCTLLIDYGLRPERERAKESVWLLLSIACTSRANSGIRLSVNRYLWTWWMLILLLTDLSCFCEITRFYAVAHVVAPPKYVFVQVRLAPLSLSLSVSLCPIHTGFVVCVYSSKL